MFKRLGQRYIFCFRPIVFCLFTRCLQHHVSLGSVTVSELQNLFQIGVVVLQQFFSQQSGGVIQPGVAGAHQQLIKLAQLDGPRLQRVPARDQFPLAQYPAVLHQGCGEARNLQ